MGEYITYNGRLTKIGTCEDLYYTRFEQLKAAIESGEATQAAGNLPVIDYINPAEGFRYRFPFPDEDLEDLGGFYEWGYSRGFPIQIYEDLAPQLMGAIKTEFNHFEVIDEKTRQSIPCPAYQAEGDKYVYLCQQKQVDGVLWIVVRCQCCESKIRLNETMARELCECLKRKPRKFTKIIRQRIRDGYKASWDI